MTTAIDTNILIALWNEDDTLNNAARSALDAALGRGSLIVAAPVFVELLASPSRTEAFLDSFCKETGITVDWELGEPIWRAAGQAFQLYAGRRRKQRDSGPRRILADLLIGAHALKNGFGLLTFDDHLYRAAFPRLAIINI
ncbi:MAG: type II toxin-antitoxin system VapC family toxin [Candidatus Acidiferrales bacterium]|jgi:predicted nucleic acid-binding protein